MTIKEFSIQKKQIVFFSTIQESFKNVDRETQEQIRLAKFDCRVSCLVLGFLALFSLAIGTYLAREGLESCFVHASHDFTLLGGGLSLDLLGIGLSMGVIFIGSRSYGYIEKLKTGAKGIRNEIIGIDDLFRELEFADDVETVKKFLKVAHEGRAVSFFFRSNSKKIFSSSKTCYSKSDV